MALKARKKAGLGALLLLDVDADVLRFLLQLLHRLTHTRTSCLVAFVVELREVVFEAHNEILQLAILAHLHTSVGFMQEEKKGAGAPPVVFGARNLTHRPTPVKQKSPQNGPKSQFILHSPDLSPLYS